jgi:membrane associated rhomboid family serine protease
LTEVRTGGVAYLAHITGFLFGVIFARTLVDRRRLMYRGVGY